MNFAGSVLLIGKLTVPLVINAVRNSRKNKIFQTKSTTKRNFIFTVRGIKHSKNRNMPLISFAIALWKNA
jgi:hypothetical protein